MEDCNQARTMFDYAKPSFKRIEYNIVRPPVNANNFEIKLNITQIM